MRTYYVLQQDLGEWTDYQRFNSSLKEHALKHYNEVEAARQDGTGATCRWRLIERTDTEIRASHQRF